MDATIELVQQLEAKYGSVTNAPDDDPILKKLYSITGAADSEKKTERVYVVINQKTGQKWGFKSQGAAGKYFHHDKSWFYGLSKARANPKRKYRAEILEVIE